MYSKRIGLRAAICGLFCCLSLALYGQTAVNTIERSFGSKDEVKIEHRYGPLLIVPSTNGQIKVVSKLYAEANSSEDMERLKQQHELKISESGNTLSLITDFDVKNWNSNNGRIKLEFSDGTRIKDLRNVKLELTVHVPDRSSLSVANRYDEIRIPEGVKGNLDLTIHSGRLEVGPVSGQLTMDVKYSKGEIGSFSNGMLKVYDCDLKFGNAEDVELNSKYSELEFGSFSSLKAETYDDDISWKTVKGNLVINDKYSKFDIGRFNSAQWDVYDTDIESDGGNELLVKSKYSGFDLREIGKIAFEDSFDDEVQIDRAGQLSAQAKYTTFRIGVLRSKLFLRSYDDDVQIGELTGPLEGIDFEGKYTDLSLRLPSDAAYHLDANLTYGRLIYPEDRLENLYHKEKNDKLELQAKTKGAAAGSPKVSIVSYDGKITIQ